MHIKYMTITRLDLYCYLISHHAGFWLNAYISSPTKSKQQIDLRTSGTNRKSPFNCVMFYQLFINLCLFLSHLFFESESSKFFCSFAPQIPYCVHSMCQELLSALGTKNKQNKQGPWFYIKFTF